MIEVSIIGEYLTQWDKNRYLKIVTDEAMENLTVNAASFLDTTVMSFTVEKESDGFYTAKIPDELLEDDTYLLVWISNGDYIVSEKFKFPIEHKPKEETEDVEDGLLSENGDLLNTENGKAILVETGNSIKISNLPIAESLTDDSVFPVVQDGETKKVAYSALKGGFTVEPNAGAHNSLYRGKYLGDAVTEEQYAQIASGTFDDLFIGDYWTLGGETWRIAAFDYYLNTGDTPCTSHHIVVVPDKTSNVGKMDTQVGSGLGYGGSPLRESGLNIAKYTIEYYLFRGHVLKHRVMFVNDTRSGAATSSAYYDSTVDLMSEIMVFGSPISMSVSNGSYRRASNGIEKSQLPLFAHDHSLICNGQNWWLRDLAYPNGFCYVGADGCAWCADADSSFNLRPFVCVC